MITRLLLSLRKATTSQEHAWSFGKPTIDTVMFASHKGPVSTDDEIHLDTFANTGEGGQGQA